MSLFVLLPSWLGRLQLSPNVGIFVTMNPGYAGRSELPDNLKQLFRPVAMIQPDWQLIAQVMLFTQGFEHAEELSSRAVLCFTLASQQLSSQSHYDFGLRALKSVLVSAGALKRRQNDSLAAPQGADGDADMEEGGGGGSGNSSSSGGSTFNEELMVRAWNRSLFLFGRFM